MKGLPEDMIPDRDNVVYWDTERKLFYITHWTDGGNNDYCERIYIDPFDIQPKQRLGS